ncbi:MAG TPA: TadE family protein [Pilimelia sp.]|nr:TadE family protein [Pilimelia sp.]
MTPPLKRRWSRGSDAGSSTVELTLLTPAIVALLLFVVFCGRAASAQLDLDAAARAAARAASLTRTVPAATAQARRVALDTLAAHRVTCADPTIAVNTRGLTPGGSVTVTLTCRLRLSDLGLIKVPGSRTVSASSTAPIDQWRGRALGFANSEASSATNPSMGGL